MSPTLNTEVFQTLAKAADVVGRMEKFEERQDKAFEKWERTLEARDKAMESRDERLRKLENWQSWMMGIGVCVGCMMTITTIVSANMVLDQVREVRAAVVRSK